MMFPVPSRRGLALALLLALVAGPTGVAGVLHPFDDVEYRTGSVADRSASESLGDGRDSGVHCPTCHLLRGVRWSVSATPLPGILPQAAVSPAGTGEAICAVDLQYATSGRSPPAADTPPTA